MKIVIVNPAISLGGAEVVAFRFAIYLGKFGHDVTFVTSYIDSAGLFFNGIPYDERMKIVTPSSKISVGYLSTRALGQFGRFAVLKRLLEDTVRRDDVDVINAHNFSAAWASGFMSNILKVWTCNQVYSEMARLWNKGTPLLYCLDVLRSYPCGVLEALSAKRFNVITVLSAIGKRDIRRYFGRDSVIIRTPIDDVFFESMDPEPLISKFDLDNGFIVSQIGWLISEKNPLASLLAVKLLSKKIPRIKLVFGGVGRLEYLLRRQARLLDVQDNVIFAGKLSQLDVARLHKASAISLFVPEKHAWGLAPFEAIMQGSIPIVSRNTGAAEVLEDLQAGTIIDDPTPQQIAQAIYKIYMNPDAYLQSLKDARQYTATNLNFRAYTEKMLNVFKGRVTDVYDGK